MAEVGNWRGREQRGGSGEGWEQRGGVPESVENQVFRRYPDATILEPSLEVLTSDHWGLLPALTYPLSSPRPVTSVQVTPESDEYQRLSSCVAATCLTPSDDMATPPVPMLVASPQFAVMPATSVHVAPESLDLYIVPSAPGPVVAVWMEPSADMALFRQYFEGPLVVHVTPASLEMNIGLEVDVNAVMCVPSGLTAQCMIDPA